MGISSFILSHSVSIKPIRASKILLFFTFLTLIALLRNNNHNTIILATIYRAIELIFFVLFVGLFYNWLKNKHYDTQKIIVYGIIVPFSIYCLVNIFGWLLGIKLEGQEELAIGKCVFLGQFGLDIERVQFPFGSGINSFATVVGSVVTLAISHLLFIKKNRYIILVCVFILTIVLALTDSRSSLFYPITSVLLVWFIRLTRLKKTLRILPYIPLVAPFILLLLVMALKNLGLVSSISRESEEVASANGRQLIWIVSIAKLLNFKLIHLIGYGQYGHFASGASEVYGFMFGRWKYGFLTHPHNTILMVVFDYGYLGLIILIVLFRNMNNNIQNLWANKEIEISNVFLSFFIYIILITTTESYLGLYYMNALYVFILVVMLLDNQFIKSNRNILKMSK